MPFESFKAAPPPPPPPPKVNWSEILALVSTVKTARANGHPDWGKHLDTLLTLLEKHGRNS